eukprot:TRINITY_DN10630_c0_g1_i1.p1 TRINITY_DN10630_c0_g1~~TRINITY_DN10630_c0_g1_i1.p1  ORF type:complete len:285 (+),score=63.89 TRINITY_DN10630_c0_g1_i1:26-856(+)
MTDNEQNEETKSPILVRSKRDLQVHPKLSTSQSNPEIQPHKKDGRGKSPKPILKPKERTKHAEEKLHVDKKSANDRKLSSPRERRKEGPKKEDSSKETGKTKEKKESSSLAKVKKETKEGGEPQTAKDRPRKENMSFGDLNHDGGGLGQNKPQLDAIKTENTVVVGPKPEGHKPESIGRHGFQAAMWGNGVFVSENLLKLDALGGGGPFVPKVVDETVGTGHSTLNDSKKKTGNDPSPEEDAIARRRRKEKEDKEIANDKGKRKLYWGKRKEEAPS